MLAFFWGCVSSIQTGEDFNSLKPMLDSKHSSAKRNNLGRLLAVETG
jgi:hypothetical protein